MSSSSSDEDIQDEFGSPSSSSKALAAQRKKKEDEKKKAAQAWNTITVIAVKPNIPLADSGLTKGMQGWVIEIKGNGMRNISNLCYDSKTRSTPSKMKFFDNTGVCCWIFPKPDPNNPKESFKEERDGKKYDVRRLVRMVMFDAEGEMTQEIIRSSILNKFIPQYEKRVLQKDGELDKNNILSLAEDWYQEVASWSDVIKQGDLPDLFNKTWGANTEWTGPKNFSDFVKIDKAYLYSMWEVGKIPLEVLKKLRFSQNMLEPEDWERVPAGYGRQLFPVAARAPAPAAPARVAAMVADTSSTIVDSSQSTSTPAKQSSRKRTAAKSVGSQQSKKKSKAAKEHKDGIDDDGFSNGKPTPPGLKSKPAELREDLIVSSSTDEADENKGASGSS